MKKISNFRKALQYAKKQKKQFILYLFGNITLTVIGAITPLLGAKQLLYITDGLLDSLLKISLCLFAIEFTSNIARYFSRKHAQLFSREVAKNIQMELANQVLHIENADLDKKSSGVIIDRLTKDTTHISDIFIDMTFSFTDLITNIGILFAIFIINKWIFLYYCIAVTIIFFLEKTRIKKFNERDKRFRKISEQNTGFVGELVRGLRDIKVLNASKSFLKMTNDRINATNEEKFKMSTVTRRYTLLTTSVKDLLDLLLIVLFIFMINHEHLTIEAAIVLYMYRHKVFNLLTLFSNALEWYKDFNLSATRVFELIDSKEYRKEKFGNKHLDKVKGQFEFRNVYFSYNNNKPVLKGVSFKIKPKQTVSFVGKSGSGKSTIFALLAKLYTINKGDILIDNVSIKELDEDTIRGNISIITQNPYIFNMTIRQNLEIIKDKLTEEDMIEACKTAELHDFIMSLPDGYDTLIGEGGINLSGGQRQRLAIARALVQKTEIILFDEATSALDNETQLSIQTAINNMKNKYTILIIAHRLSTVINSDCIMFLNDGVISNIGSHHELLKKDKEYKKLYEMEMEKNQ